MLHFYESVIPSGCLCTVFKEFPKRWEKHSADCTKDKEPCWVSSVRSTVADSPPAAAEENVMSAWSLLCVAEAISEILRVAWKSRPSRDLLLVFGILTQQNEALEKKRLWSWTLGSYPDSVSLLHELEQGTWHPHDPCSRSVWAVLVWQMSGAILEPFEWCLSNLGVSFLHCDLEPLFTVISQQNLLTLVESILRLQLCLFWNHPSIMSIRSTHSISDDSYINSEDIESFKC